MSRPLTLILLSAAALSTAACAYNETLGRSQFLIVDDSALTQQSEAAWAQALRTQPTSSDAAANARVRRVGARLVEAAGRSQLGLRRLRQPEPQRLRPAVRQDRRHHRPAEPGPQ